MCISFKVAYKCSQITVIKVRWNYMERNFDIDDYARLQHKKPCFIPVLEKRLILKAYWIC